MPYCASCHDGHFRTDHQHLIHIQNSPNHDVCMDCWIDFSTALGLKEHWVQSRNHDYCQYCAVHFYSNEALEYHYENDHPYCPPCRKVFNNNLGLVEHYRQSDRHHYCAPCNRHFDSHFYSAIHRPKDVKCPFGCGGAFISRAALVLHLESGACKSGVNRTLINNYVRQHDTSNMITDPARMITAGSGSFSQDITYIATARSWNGSGYECYLCHGVYGSLNGLNQHLASPRHQDKIYIYRGPSCGVHFTALSGLIQHIESEKCGVSKFKAVQNAMDSMLGQMGRLTM